MIARRFYPQAVWPVSHFMVYAWLFTLPKVRFLFNIFIMFPATMMRLYIRIKSCSLTHCCAEFQLLANGYLQMLVLILRGVYSVICTYPRQPARGKSSDLLGAQRADTVEHDRKGGGGGDCVHCGRGNATFLGTKQRPLAQISLLFWMCHCDLHTILPMPCFNETCFFVPFTCNSTLSVTASLCCNLKEVLCLPCGDI